MREWNHSKKLRKFYVSGLHCTFAHSDPADDRLPDREDRAHAPVGIVRARRGGGAVGVVVVDVGLLRGQFAALRRQLPPQRVVRLAALQPPLRLPQLLGVHGVHGVGADDEEEETDRGFKCERRILMSERKSDTHHSVCRVRRQLYFA